MKKQRTLESKIVAASPTVHEPGLLPYRIVIRDMGEQLVVHTEVIETGKTPWFHHGDYFPTGNDAATARGPAPRRFAKPGLGSRIGHGVRCSWTRRRPRDLPK